MMIAAVAWSVVIKILYQNVNGLSYMCRHILTIVVCVSLGVCVCLCVCEEYLHVCLFEWPTTLCNCIQSRPYMNVLYISHTYTHSRP